MANLSSLGLGHHDKPDPHYLNLSRQLGELLSQLRLLEERYANLRREHQLISKNMIDNHQAIRKYQRRLSDDILDLKQKFSDLRSQVNLMLVELRGSARIDELKTVEHYVDLWQPLSFITREEAEKLVKEAFEKRKD